MTVVTAAVEGLLDEAVLRRLTDDAGIIVTKVYGKEGKSKLLERIQAYNNAAQYYPWIVMIDLDQDNDCAPPFCHLHLPEPAPNMYFRVAVREVEAWLLADRPGLARFLGIATSKIPLSPEDLPDPKAFIVQLARTSRRREIRDSMVPTLESGRKVGIAYTSRMIEFVSDKNAGWNPVEAAGASNSLARCISRFRDLAAALD